MQISMYSYPDPYIRVMVDRNMETLVRNLFAAGDGAGLSRDIVNAAAGAIAARGILKKGDELIITF